MGRDTDYLAANYPTEMIALAQTRRSRAFGFDRLGDDVAGAAIPADWWAVRSPIKRLERELDQDSKYAPLARSFLLPTEFSIEQFCEQHSR
jgi:hypothetical protein